MAKISYLISKNSKSSGKHLFHFDGSGSGSFFQKWFNKDHDEINSNPTDLKDLLSKIVSEFNGDSESVREKRIEFEGSCEEIKEFASWSISESSNLYASATSRRLSIASRNSGTSRTTVSHAQCRSIDP